jgi:hypothetical protein
MAPPEGGARKPQLTPTVQFRGEAFINFDERPARLTQFNGLAFGEGLPLGDGLAPGLHNPLDNYVV